MVEFPDSARSFVITVSSLDDFADFMTSRIVSRKGLRRVLIGASDPSIAKTLEEKWESFQSFLASEIKPEEYRSLFRPTDWDAEGETWFYHYGPQMGDEVLGRVKKIHQSMLMEFAHEKGLPQIGNTPDRVRGLVHFLSNLKPLMTSPDPRNWNQNLKDVPAVILGAGPSLKDSLSALAPYRNRFALIAADTLLKPLTDQGVSPDIVASIERDDEILDLLKDGRTHENTFLCGSVVLKNEILNAYQGPKTLVLGPYQFNSWVGIERLAFSYGRSCVGLGLTLALTMGCNPIVLAGIDLCFSESGEAHDGSVPYAKSDNYKRQRHQWAQESFEMRNSEGQPVRTHIYWNQFRREFENFIDRSSARVFNLSRSGLPIQGAELLPLEDLPKVLSTDHGNIFQKLSQQLPYRRNEKARSELGELMRRSDLVFSELDGLQRVLVERDSKAFLSVLKESPSYEALYAPLLKHDLYRIETNDEAVWKRLSAALDELGPALQQAKQDSADLLRSETILF